MYFSSDHFIAFVWEPQKIGPEVMDLVRQTSTRAIFDLSFTEPCQFAAHLKEAGATEIKILADDIMSSSLEDFLVTSGIQTLWVDYCPDLCRFPPEVFLARLTDLGKKYRCIPITGDLTLLQKLNNLDYPPKAIAIKGSEAGGLVSSESTSILFSAARRNLTNQTNKIDLIIWGGIATPEAVAAFLTTGARGIVFESLHWQTELARGERPKEFLVRLQPDHTTVVGKSLGIYCRLFDKGNSTSRQRGR